MSAQNKIQNVLKRAQQLDISPTFLPYSGVEIVTGLQDEDGKDIPPYFSGDRSGRVLTINNPWGTQAQADDLIAKIRGFTYQPYEATGALVDPTAELGDGVSVNDVYSGIYKLSRNFSSLMSANISAPQSEDLDHEYPYESKADRAITRRFSAMESELSINSGKIEAKVSKQSPEGQTSFSWNLTDSAWEVKSGANTIFKVSSVGAEVRGKITATSGSIGGFTINENNSNAIQFNGLTWNGSKTGIYLGTQGIQLGAANGAFFQASASGAVKAHNMTLTGTLTIGGQTITAAALRSGAQSAYSNSGTWSSASSGWNNATRTGTTSYPSSFTCANLIAKTDVAANSYHYSGHALYLGTIKDYYGTDRKVVMYL